MLHCLLQVHAAVLNAGEQGLQVLHMLVRDLDLLFQQPGHLQGGIHLPDLQNLLRVGGLAVDGDGTHVLPGGNAPGQLRELRALPIRPDVQLHQAALTVDEARLVQGVQVLPGPLLVAVVELRQGGRLLRQPLGIRPRWPGGQQSQHHGQGQQYAQHPSCHSFHLKNSFLRGFLSRSRHTGRPRASTLSRSF